MKTFLLLFLLILCSCATPIQQIKVPCPKLSKSETLGSLALLVMQQGLSVKQSDANLGFLQAESEPSSMIYPAGTMRKVWTFTLSGDTITASAKTILVTTGTYGQQTGSAETYYSDDASKDWLWYWAIRNGLETLCGNKLIFIERNR